jgi:hypothetical protein
LLYDPIATISRAFQGTSVNRRILRAAAAVTAAGIVVKAVAIRKEFVVAGVFGRGDYWYVRRTASKKVRQAVRLPSAP